MAIIRPPETTAIIRGTNGDDTLVATAAGQALYGYRGRDTLISAFDRTALYGGKDADRLTTTLELEIGYSDDSRPIVDTLLHQFGGGEDDALEATTAVRNHAESARETRSEAVLNGGGGNDDLSVTASVISEYASVFNKATLLGGGGRDTLTANLNTILTTGGTRTPEDTTSDLTMHGGSGDDVLEAVVSASGQYGSDAGAYAVNRLEGDSGDDAITLKVDSASEYDVRFDNNLRGGSGDDTIDIFSRAASFEETVLHTLARGGSGDDVITVESDAYDVGNEDPERPSVETRIFGDSGSDTLSAIGRAVGQPAYDGSATATVLNFINGGSGADRMSAEARAKAYFPITDGLAATASNELIGGSGDDVMKAEASAIGEGGIIARNHLSGDSGNDTLIATAYAENFFGKADAYTSHSENWIDGGAGDDIISAIATIDGSRWRKALYATNQIVAGNGDDKVTARSEGVYNEEGGLVLLNAVDAGRGDDQVEVLFGGSAEYGVAATSQIDGGKGDDTLIARSVGLGSNSGTSTFHEIAGGSGSDSLTAETIGGGAAAFSAMTSLSGGTGADRLVSFIDGSAISNYGSGGPVEATVDLSGGKHRDVLVAETRLSAESMAIARVVLEGDAGRDTLTAETVARSTADSGPRQVIAENVLKGGDGDDELTASVLVTWDQAVDIATATNLLDGGDGDDVLLAKVEQGSKAGSSTLLGGACDDVLVVFGGTDNVLDGGTGKDRLYSGDGDERMIGGEDSDRFVFDTEVDQGTDVVADLQGDIDQLQFLGVADLAALDSVCTVTDAGPGGDVTAVFDSGSTLVFEGVGTGAIDSIADLLVDPGDQLLF